jgi:hypothetical protein
MMSPNASKKKILSGVKTKLVPLKDRQDDVKQPDDLMDSDNRCECEKPETSSHIVSAFKHKQIAESSKPGAVRDSN